MVERPLRVRVVPLSPRVLVAQSVEHLTWGGCVKSILGKQGPSGIGAVPKRSTINQGVESSSLSGDTTKEREERNMTNEMKIIAFEARYNKLYCNGRNIKSPGVMRKIARKKRKLESQQNAD